MEKKHTCVVLICIPKARTSYYRTIFNICFYGLDFKLHKLEKFTLTLLQQFNQSDCLLLFQGVI